MYLFYACLVFSLSWLSACPIWWEWLPASMRLSRWSWQWASQHLSASQWSSSLCRSVSLTSCMRAVYFDNHSMIYRGNHNVTLAFPTDQVWLHFLSWCAFRLFDCADLRRHPLHLHPWQNSTYCVCRTRSFALHLCKSYDKLFSPSFTVYNDNDTVAVNIISIFLTPMHRKICKFNAGSGFKSHPSLCWAFLEFEGVVMTECCVSVAIFHWKSLMMATVLCKTRVSC